MGSKDLGSNLHHNNYDIAFKYVSELFQDDFLGSLEIKAAKVVDILPTDLASIETYDGRIDFLFLLEDDTLLHLEFQSTFNEKDLERFLRYDIGLYDKYRKPIRTIVIYGAGIKGQSVVSQKDYGSVKYHTEAKCVGDIDGDVLVKELMSKAESGQTLSNEDLASLVLLPLMKTSVPRIDRTIDVVQISRYIEDEDVQSRVVSMIFTMSSKFFKDEHELERLMGVIEMTKLYEAMEKKITRKQDERIFQAIDMLKTGKTVDEVAKAVKLPLDTVAELKRKL